MKQVNDILLEGDLTKKANKGILADIKYNHTTKSIIEIVAKNLKIFFLKFLIFKPKINNENEIHKP